MIKVLKVRLIDLKIYWEVKRITSLGLLRVRSSRYNAVAYCVSETKNLKALWRVLGETFWLVFGVVLFAIFLQVANKYVAPHLAQLGFAVVEDTDYVTFLSAVGGIGGVFIGLYYAALSSVGSAIYSKVPNNIRDLLAQERSGSVYMRFLSALTLLCIALIVFRVCGLPRIILAVPVVGLLAGVGVVAFVKLGRNAFNLFDPTALSHHIFEDLSKWISVVRVNGYQWNDPAFQNHAYIRANKSIDTLKILVDIAAKERHQNGRPLVGLVCHVLAFLASYEKIKMLVPSDSYWYPQQFKHKDWYASAGYSVRIAHLTGTSLQPDTTRNYNWVEERLYPEILRCIVINLDVGRHQEVMRILNYVEMYIAVIAISGDVSKAFDFIDQVSSVIIENISRKRDAAPSLNDIEQMSVVEAVAILPISIALSLAGYAGRCKKEIIARQLKAVKWGVKNSIYVQNIPSHLLSQMEWLQTRIDFETKAEGARVTPYWYQLEIMCFAEAKVLAKSIGVFPERSKSFFAKVYSVLQGHVNPWLYASVQSREHEFWYKANNTLDCLKENWLEIESSRILHALSWPSVDISSIEDKMENYKRGLVKDMAVKGVSLLSSDMPSGYPDLTGQFLHITGESLLDAMCVNDVELVSAIFNMYLLGCFARFDKLRSTITTIDDVEYKFRIASAVIMDVVEISGFAKLLAETHQDNRLWAIVSGAWGAAIDSERGSAIVENLKSIFQLAKGGYVIPHRSDLRFEWETKIKSLLEKLPRKHVESDSLYRSETVAVHPRKLVRLSAKEGYGKLPSGLDLFVVFYYINLKLVTGFELDREQEHLVKSLAEFGSDDGEGVSA